MKILNLYLTLRRIISSVLNNDIDSNKSVKQIIYRDNPQLKSSNITDYERVCILRHWAALIINSSTYSLLFDIRQPVFSSLQLHEMYELFSNNTGGVWCSGASLFLKNIYKLFGYEAHSLNYGTPDAFTHVSTLVTVEYNKKKILSVQDAYFDITYESLDGEPMDYFTLLKRLVDRRDDDISIVEYQPPLARNFYVYSGDTWENLDDCTYIEQMSTDSPKKGSVTHMLCPFTPEFALGAFLDKINQYLVDNGLPGRLVYLHLFPFSVDEDSQGTILTAAREITAWPPVINLKKNSPGEGMK